VTEATDRLVVRVDARPELSALRALMLASVREGIDDLENGDYVELADPELEGYFEELVIAAARQPGVR
jgi:hypothetical protein